MLKRTTKRMLAESVVDNATKCGSHPCKFPPIAQWKKIHYAYQEEGSYNETDGAAVIEMLDGTIWVATESGDTTGHGCQCSGDTAKFSSLAEAKRLGLTDSQRTALKIQLQ